MHAGGLTFPMQRCFSDLVCQPLVTSYVIDAYLFGRVACLDPRVPAHDALRLTVDITTKAERQWPAGEDHWVALATSNSTVNRVQDDANALLQLSIRCGDLRSPGATKRCNGSLGLRDDDDDDEG